MDELVKYTRLVFEVRYLNDEINFRAIDDQIENGISRCMCMPGVAANYILAVLTKCLKGNLGNADIIWNSEHHRYIAQYKNDAEMMWFCNFCGELESCVYREDVCAERSNMRGIKESERDFAYIKIRKGSDVKKEYNIKKDSYRIEKCLFNFPEAEFNTKDRVQLFSYIANQYRTELDMDQYLDMLFRLYFFLFPNECLSMIKEYCKSTEERAYFEYNKKVLEDYLTMASNANSQNEYVEFVGLSGFLGIDFKRVYDFYRMSKECGDPKMLNEVVNGRRNCVDANEVKEVLEDYCGYYMRS